MKSVPVLTDPETTEASVNGVMKGLRLPRPGAAVMGGATQTRHHERGDAIVRITTSTICGTDLHILKGAS